MQSASATRTPRSRDSARAVRHRGESCSPTEGALPAGSIRWSPASVSRRISSACQLRPPVRRRCRLAPLQWRRRADLERPHQAHLRPLNGPIARRHDGLIDWFAKELAGLRVRRPSRLHMPPDMCLRHRHQRRRAIRSRPAIAQNPASSSGCLDTAHDRDRIGAGRGRAAIAAERRAQGAIVGPIENPRRLHFALESRPENGKTSAPSTTVGGLRTQSCEWRAASTSPRARRSPIAAARPCRHACCAASRPRRSARG